MGYHSGQRAVGGRLCGRTARLEGSMRRWTVLVTALLLAGVGCARDDQRGESAPGRAYTAGDAPAPLRPAADRAQQAFDEFHEQFTARLEEELGRGGPVHAISVYRDEAARLAAEMGRKYNMRIGRTSHHLRSPRNAPPRWAEPHVTAANARSAADAPVRVVDMDPVVGVLEPLETTAVCVLCHGPETQLSPEILGAIRKTYPGDRATGFTPGEVRGWLWAEVPRR
jgi:hypothetical protein